MEQLGIIIQARLGASRLPGKVLLPFWKNKGILELLIDKLENMNLNVPIIIATTTNKLDDKIQDHFIHYKNLKVYRGDEHNVVKRFIDAADKFNLSKIIRICADNPFLETWALEKLIIDFKKRDIDYLNFEINNIPNMKTHFGFWAEGVTLNALKKVVELTDEKEYLEHVTNFIYSHKNIFITDSYRIDLKKYNEKIRLTLDTPEDFDVQKGIFADLISQFPNQDYKIIDIINYIENHSELIDFMQKQINNQAK